MDDREISVAALSNGFLEDTDRFAIPSPNSGRGLG